MNGTFSEQDIYEINNSSVYTFSSKKPKSHTAVLIVTCAVVFLALAVAIVLLATGKLDVGGASLVLLGSFFVMVIYIIKHLQFDATAALTQYFVDSQQNCYKIQFTKVCAKAVRVERHFSLIPLVGEVKTFIDAMQKLKVKEGYMKDAYTESQDKLLGYYYVKRFKQGIKDWNWYDGGEAKVKLLGNINSVKIPAGYTLAE